MSNEGQYHRLAKRYFEMATQSRNAVEKSGLMAMARSWALLAKQSGIAELTEGCDNQSARNRRGDEVRGCPPKVQRF